MAVGYAHDAAAAEEVAEEIATSGGKSLVFGCDVQDPDAIESAVASVLERFGKIDVLVNNAGITRDRSLAKMSREEWNDVLQTNLSSVFHMTARVLPHMVQAGYGRIVNISSVIGVHGNFGQANYAAAKAGIIGYEIGCARAQDPRHGQRDRSRLHRDRDDRGHAGRGPRQDPGEDPDGPIRESEEIAQAVEFLVSHGDYVTGQVIAIDGGMYT